MKHIHKRVPLDMVSEYTAKGWVIWKREERSAVLVWTKAGEPR